MLILENSEKVANSTKLQKQVNENCTERREKTCIFSHIRIREKEKMDKLNNNKK